MANLTRYKQKIFANNSNQVGVFGTGTNKVASKNVETLQSSDYEDGWSAAIITNKNYPIWQERDGVDYGFSYQLAYLMQKGIPDWLSTETYYQNDYCKVGNVIYYSLQDNNVGQNPSSTTGYWKLAIVQAMIPDYNSGVTVSTFPYTATANGVLYFRLKNSNTLNVTINGAEVAYNEENSGVTHEQYIGFLIPMATNDVLTASDTSKISNAIFYPYKGV